jgi:membrane associated rhomboid family serine protease
VITLLSLNIAVFLYQLLSGPGAEDLIWEFGLVPYRLAHPSYYGWQSLPSAVLSPITATFLHGGLLHLGGNMLFLWVFGDNLEDRLGHWGFLVFYLLAGVVGNLAHTIVLADSRIPTIGASGAVAGVLAGYLRLFPQSRVRTLLLLGPFITIARVPALFLIGFWAVLQFLAGLATLNPLAAQTAGVAYWAHIGGFAAGLATVRMFRPGRR